MTEATTRTDDAGGTVRISVHGEIDLANVATVDGDLRSRIGNRHTDVVVDLTGLRHLDSSGLRMLFSLATRLELLQIGFRLHVPRGAPTRRVIELSGLAGVANLEPG